MGPLLFVNLVMYILVLGLAGWSIDKYIDRETHHRMLIFSSFSHSVSVLVVLNFNMN